MVIPKWYSSKPRGWLWRKWYSTGDEKVDSEKRLLEFRCHCGHALFLPVLMCNTRTMPPNPLQLGVDQDTAPVQTCQACRKCSSSAVRTKHTFPRPLPQYAMACSNLKADLYTVQLQCLTSYTQAPSHEQVKDRVEQTTLGVQMAREKRQVGEGEVVPQKRVSCSEPPACPHFSLVSLMTKKFQLHVF